MFDLSEILRIIRTATQVTPEFVSLVRAMAQQAHTSDQAQLQSALAEAQARSDALHADVQREAAQAQG